MGNTAAKVAARASVAQVAASHCPKMSRAEQALASLPSDSAVRRDAEAAMQFDQLRIAQEQRLDGIPLEQENAKDQKLETLMLQAMQHPDGKIEYREHLLPMEQSSLGQSLTAQV
jgi:hypothetical protein